MMAMVFAIQKPVFLSRCDAANDTGQLPRRLKDSGGSRRENNVTLSSGMPPHPLPYLVPYPEDCPRLLDGPFPGREWKSGPTITTIGMMSPSLPSRVTNPDLHRRLPRLIPVAKIVSNETL